MTDTTQSTTPAEDQEKKNCLPEEVKVPDPQWGTPCKPKCECPPGACGGASTCLDDLIAGQSKAMKAGDTAKEFVEVLKGLQTKVQSALVSYTPAKVADLTAIWEGQHAKIVEAGRQIECAVPCWQCVVLCHLCRRLDRIRRQRNRLYGDGNPYAEVKSLLEKLAWLERSEIHRQREHDRVKDLLKAWEDPAKAIAEALDKNENLRKEILGKLQSDTATALYQFFMVLVLRHAAVAPPGKKGVVTSALGKYLDICKACDPGKEVACCGVDVGELPIRLEMLGYLPSLIDPADLDDRICCLATNRFVPTKDALAQVKGELANAKAEVDRIREAVKVDALRESVAKAFKEEITLPIDCSTRYKPTDGSQPGGCGSGSDSSTTR